ncbi:MAG TPA: response regulator [Nitrospiraceae bacterium]|jgi:DNA-binding NtrC family response regulator
MPQDLPPPQTFPIQFPRLLVAEKDFSAIEPLIRTFGDRHLDLDYDVCSSYPSAMRKLLASPYQLIICGAHLAEIDDFLLLERTKALDPLVPFVVTAGASEKESAGRLLEQGAFDVITRPLDHEQTVRTIRLALWLNKLRNIIARKERALDRYNQHLTDYPDDREEIENLFKRTLSCFDRTISCVEGTILRLEATTECFPNLAMEVEQQARKRALERLKLFPK